jgi:hypothetical protein
MGKRGNGEGGITHLSDGRWQARITLEGGRRKAFYAKTRAAAAAKLNAALRDRDRGLPVGMDERQTVGQYLARWLETVKPTIRPRTWTRYRELVTLHAVPTLGTTALPKLSAQQVQALYSAKLAGRGPEPDDGAAPGDGAAPRAGAGRTPCLGAAQRVRSGANAAHGPPRDPAPHTRAGAGTAGRRLHRQARDPVRARRHDGHAPGRVIGPYVAQRGSGQGQPTRLQHDAAHRRGFHRLRAEDCPQPSAHHPRHHCYRSPASASHLSIGAASTGRRGLG